MGANTSNAGLSMSAASEGKSKKNKQLTFPVLQVAADPYSDLDYFDICTIPVLYIFPPSSLYNIFQVASSFTWRLPEKRLTKLKTSRTFQGWDCALGNFTAD